MGSASKRKGSRVEREIVALLQAEGVESAKVPLSGAVGGDYAGDIHLGGGAFIGEVKARKNGEGFKVMQKWLGDNDFLICKQDRQAPFVAMNWHTFVDLLKAALK